LDPGDSLPEAIANKKVVSMQLGRFRFRQSIIRLSILIVIGIVPNYRPVLASESISLERYLKQVQTSHFGYKASEATKSASTLAGTEVEMAYVPTVFSNVQHMHDAKPTANPRIQGTATDSLSYLVGVGKMFSTGTQTKLSFGLNEIQILGQSPASNEEAAFAPHPKFITGSTTLELSHPLWKNRNGREFRSQNDLLKAQANATIDGEKFKEKLVMAEAELTYHRLSLANEMIEFQQSSQKRFKKLRDWNKQRVNTQLADRTDLLQAEAALAAKSIEIRQAEDDRKAVSRAFNSLRGIASDAVPEGLLDSNRGNSLPLPSPSARPARLDVEAAKELTRIADAKSAIESEKYKANVEIFAQYGLNGRTEYGEHRQLTIPGAPLTPAAPENSRNAARIDTAGDALTNQYPTSVIGIRISAPLGGDVKSRKEQALSLERDAARLNAEQKAFEAQRDWLDLSKRLADARERIELAKNLETIQLEKLEHEQTKQRSGRSTTYQVLMFEQDYDTAKLNSIRIKAESFELISRMKTFGLK
jgi:outer membrane protein TolC